MNVSKKIKFYGLFLMFFILAMTSQGFGQIKFFTTENPIPNKYIVVLNEDPFNNDPKLAVNDSAQELASAYNGQAELIYESAIKGFSVAMSEEDAIALSEDPQVAYVTEDNEVYLTDTQFNAPWNLDRIDQRDLPLSTTYNYNANGAGVAAYIIDSGINRGHAEFGGLGGRAVVGADFVGGNGTDCNGHGTHVAGTVGGSTYGVAKGVLIVAVRVFGCSGTSANSTIIAGIDWVRANHGARSVANMSLGGGANPATDDAVRSLIASGVTCVIAAGNDNADANNTSPARVRQAITVGATDINDSRASFSNFGTAVDIFAPGVNVTSAWWDGGYNTISGTSMAAPHVTGVVAQYLQLNSTFSMPTPKTIQDALVSSASWNKVSNRGSGSPNTFLYNASFVNVDNLKPLLRYWSASSTDHYYVETWDDLGAGKYGYIVERIEGYLSPVQSSGTIPLHRYWSSSRNDHLYTTNFSELGNGAYGYVYEGITGYVYSSQQSGTLPLYRYWNPTNTDHFYTTNFSELGNGALGYTYEGISGYLVQ